ncbi:MAG: tRNA (uridine(34)/cytosine(34)/5-carboxymethylaminomethyluridine(34)-2'-O)-methyltransferase TrmL [Synechococcaceae cyanobacterium SM2_3_1]|nr:tRNA (uridine(34)/cytosine(34)/5-carboxymethylaminomethyluridine(34)-2'-O)-methyltransferase TrmL [Synechococcaceae cyanobacterium SM2_3_1]
MVQVVLVAPEIPANTGNIARTCAATGTPLHLIDPLGFHLTDRHLRRAGLDYWKAVNLQRHSSWSAFRHRYPEARCWCFSVRGQKNYTEVNYQGDDWLIFGSETQGLPDSILQAYPSLHIPLLGPVRSLNVANAVAIALFEALRQLKTTAPGS